MRARYAFRLGIVMAGLLIAGLAQAQVLNNEVEFSGTIVPDSVVQNGEGEGTLFVQMETLTLRVIVNPKTVLWDTAGEPIDFVDIPKNALIRVSGKFSSSGVLATRIQLLAGDDENSFTVSGHVTAIEASGESVQISLLGLKILADADAAADLKTGNWVSITGTIADDGWTADSIKLVKPGKKKGGQMTVEGTVTTWPVTPTDGVSIMPVDLAGDDASMNVHVTSETRVIGEIKKDAYISVTGRLIDEHNILATRVEVIAPFEIKPDAKKMEAGETESFTVKLREPAASDVPVKFDVTGCITVVKGPSDATALTQVTVLAGQRTATFYVKAGASPCEHGTVTATALESSATLSIDVRAASDQEDDDSGRPEGEIRVAFAPDHIKLGLNDSREVVVLVQPPDAADGMTFLPDGAGVTVSDTTRELGKGVAIMKITIRSQDVAGTAPVSVSAMLQGSSDAAATLTVEVEEKVTGKKK